SPSALKTTMATRTRRRWRALRPPARRCFAPTKTGRFSSGGNTMAKKQTADGLTQLKAQLKSGDFARLYVFYGEERYLLEHYLGLLRKKLLDGPAEDFNYHLFPQWAVDLQA